MKIKIKPDKEKAKSILKLVKSREDFLNQLEKIKAPSTMVAENYYEIIKELCTALLFVKGYKTLGRYAHKELIDSMKDYKLSEFEIGILQDLRTRRNKSSYEGKPIEPIYIENKKEKLKDIIDKLKKILKYKIKE